MSSRLQKKTFFKEASSAYVRGTRDKQMLKKYLDNQRIAYIGAQWKEVMGREHYRFLRGRKVKQPMNNNWSERPPPPYCNRPRSTAS